MIRYNKKLIIYLFLLLSASELLGVTFDHQANLYVDFFERKENYFLVHPPLIKDIFYNVVSLKGKRKRTIKTINRKIFGCPTGYQQNSTCPLDKLWLERKTLKIGRRVNFPVNFRRVYSRSLGNSKSRLTLVWKGDSYVPPVFPVEQFLKSINVIQDSKLFSRKDKVILIQISANFEEAISFTVSKKTARNLTELYKVSQKDFQDRVYLQYTGVHASFQDGVEYFQTYWKAYGVLINQQYFEIPVH
jgi:hypothetical protein